MIKLSGSYLSPEGIPIPYANLVITSRHNTRQTFLQIAASVTTGAGGEYQLELYPGEYVVTVVYKNGQRVVLGTITLLNDSPSGTLNDYLVDSAPELTGPIVLAEIRAAAKQAQKSEDNAKSSDLAAAQSVHNAANSASAAANSELSAGKSRDAAASSASAAALSAAAALKSEISARDAAQLAADTVANNAAMIAQVSQQVEAVSDAAVVTSAQLSASQSQQRTINGTVNGRLDALDNQSVVLANAIDSEAKSRTIADSELAQSISALQVDVNAADAALGNGITAISQALANADTIQTTLTSNIDDHLECTASTAVEAWIANANILNTLRQLTSSLSTINARLTAFESSNIK
ncbi:hypothetical protein Z042_17890 [Chania multitudinisentens RB-25]|uniref:Lambda-like tail fibre protein N-terminal domain-containing protein n=1 Tax=Chania multitudinisentens RB-25 TaxID=1441930 RepID=W0LGQ1_9GAMM|nr:prophage tail fiber N-terminal domain-containing protein [Chania multitudinisentens]AHG22901.1 hypothetical protein Z042_17890 [Chania multitudinisentens RB-25]